MWLRLCVGVWRVNKYSNKLRTLVRINVLGVPQSNARSQERRGLTAVFRCRYRAGRGQAKAGDGKRRRAHIGTPHTSEGKQKRVPAGPLSFLSKEGTANKSRRAQTTADRPQAKADEGMHKQADEVSRRQTEAGGGRCAPTSDCRKEKAAPPPLPPPRKQRQADAQA